MISFQFTAFDALLDRPRCRCPSVTSQWEPVYHNYQFRGNFFFSEVESNQKNKQKKTLKNSSSMDWIETPSGPHLALGHSLPTPGLHTFTRGNICDGRNGGVSERGGLTSSLRPCFLSSRQISLALISCRVSLETAYCSRSMRSTAAAQVDLPNFLWSARIRSYRAATPGSRGVALVFHWLIILSGLCYNEGVF